MLAFVSSTDSDIDVGIRHGHVSYGDEIRYLTWLVTSAGDACTLAGS